MSPRPPSAAVPAVSIKAPLAPGERAYLIPATLGPPRESWKRPTVTVVTVGLTDVTVALPDGRKITTASANVVRRRPADPQAPDATGRALADMTCVSCSAVWRTRARPGSPIKCPRCKWAHRAPATPPPGTLGESVTLW